jgi:Fe-S-cluster containining protein
MAATCSCCGDCCDPVWFPLGPADVRQGAVTARAEPHAANLAFAARHWHPTGAVDADGRHAYACDAFDRTSRLCTAHDARPPICRGYPWYGGPPSWSEPALPPRCSYRDDLVPHPVADLPWPSAGADRSVR